jgi:hypothetical protein
VRTRWAIAPSLAIGAAGTTKPPGRPGVSGGARYWDRTSMSSAG